MLIKGRVRARPWGCWVTSGSFMPWVHSSFEGLPSVAFVATHSKGPYLVHSGSLLSFGCALGVVGFIKGRCVGN